MGFMSHEGEEIAVKTLSATVRESGQGERRWFCGGGLHTWKVTAEETGGAFLIFEDRLEAGKATPLHTHPAADETFYMLEGEIRLRIGQQERLLGAGGIAVMPRGTPHAFLVTSPQARMLCLQTPGGGEAFYRDASDPATQDNPVGPVDFDRIREAAARTGAIEILGPPPF
jgi:quercetin dioxygenase-like cupin family protein